ncbi:MAG: hypothetical protein A2Y24_06085 [Clostridiales bacterium GWE2_32_10]|nr:MAG: hypothetical protein A2Y24_06085 [Clostridiales bacterium GWE2_32_10]HBY21547.1 hypothetical protein [Clostridiales bacterium]
MSLQTLKQGDTIGIISPSESIKGLEDMYRHGIKTLEELGYKVKVGKYAESSYYYSAARPSERLADIHEMFEDKNVKLILISVGGDTANELLEGLDYELIKRNPKMISGISDATTILLPIHDKTGLTVFYGPDLIFTFGQKDIPSEIKEQIIATWQAGSFDITPINNLIDDNGKTVNEKWKCIREGNVEGKIIAGYLDLIAILYATRQIGSLKGKIICIESMGNANTIHTWLQWLKILGVFDEIAGVILGYFPDLDTNSKHFRDIEDLILELTAGKEFPILKINELGHCIWNYSWPIGAKMRLDATNCKIELLENYFEN